MILYFISFFKRKMSDNNSEPLIYECFIVYVVDEEGSVVTFNLRPATKLSAIYDAYKTEKGFKNVKLYFNGKIIRYSNSLVKSTDLKVGDIINAISGDKGKY